jgi:hypothetical protein
MNLNAEAGGRHEARPDRLRQGYGESAEASAEAEARAYVQTDRLAFKAQEIEERVAVYCFRPIGIAIAHAARGLGWTPTAVTMIAMGVGTAGGLLLYDPKWAAVAFTLLLAHGIFDSSDGQLARMTGQTSEFGRLMDGVAGYVTHVAIYIGIIAESLARGGSLEIVGWAALAGVANVVHAVLYDYHRSSYGRVVVNGRPERLMADPPARHWIVRVYERAARALAGPHPGVESRLADRAVGGRTRDADRHRYRSAFYRVVRIWNLMGDNTRFFAIGLLLLLNRLEWFFAFVLGPQTLIFAAVWVWQARADRRFLGELR